MRFLLLLISLSILWSVRSTRNPKKFKRFKFSYDKCMTDYFCLVPPGITLETDDDALLIPMTARHPDKTAKIGVIFKPLTKSKWLVAMHNELRPSIDEGIHLTISPKTTTDHAGFKDELVAGCTKHGAVEGTANAPAFKFEADLVHSVFEDDKKIVCVGIITGTDISSMLSNVQSGFEVRLLYTIYYKLKTNNKSKAAVFQSIASKAPTGGYQALNFGMTKPFLKCDYSRLKPPILPISNYHYSGEMMELWSETIDCSKSNLFTPTDEKLDLIINTRGTNTGKFKDSIVIPKITCEKVLDTHQLFYHTESGAQIEITEDAFVACSKRVTCSKLDEFKCKKNKDFCSSPTLDCDGDKCIAIKCPNDQWIINANETIVNYNGEIVCRKEYIADKSKIGWFTDSGDILEVDEASCYMKKGCQTSNPIKTFCEANREGCATAIITEKKVSCFKHYDMIFKSKDDGSEIHTDKFVCDSKTETWIGRHAKMAASVFCIYNETKHDLLKANRPLVEEEKDKPMGTMTFIGWAILAFMLLLLSVFFLVFGFSRVVFWRARKVLEARIAKFKNVQGRNETERYRLRNPNDRNELHDMLVSLKDISKLSIDSLCRGFKLDFSIYSPEEREKFLLNCLDQWGYAKAEHIKLTIPCIRKCLELERPGNCCYPPLHEAPVRAAFTLLKVLCGCFVSHGDEHSARKIKESIGIKAKNIIFSCGLDRLEEEDIDATNLRNHAIEAALFAGHKEYANLLVKMVHEKQRNIGTPLRRYAWAAYVRWGDAEAIDRVRAWFDDEVEKLKKGTAAPDDARFGSRLEHFVYALCAGPRGKVESFTCLLIKESLFTAKLLMVAFRAMFETFPSHHETMRFIYTGHNEEIKAKCPVSTDDYKHIWNWLMIYCPVTSRGEGWMIEFLANEQNFSSEERSHIASSKDRITSMVKLYKYMFWEREIANLIQFEMKDEEPSMEEKKNKYEPMSKWQYDKNEIVPGYALPRDTAKERRREEEAKLEFKKQLLDVRGIKTAKDLVDVPEKNERNREEDAKHAPLDPDNKKVTEHKAPRETTAEFEGAVEKTPPSYKSGPAENPALAPEQTQKSEKSEKAQTDGATMIGSKSATGTATGAGKK